MTHIVHAISSAAAVCSRGNRKNHNFLCSTDMINRAFVDCLSFYVHQWKISLSCSGDTSYLIRKLALKKIRAVGYPLKRKCNLKAILKGQRRIPWPGKFRSRCRIYGSLSLCFYHQYPPEGPHGVTEMAYPLCSSCHNDILVPVAFLIFELMIIEAFQEAGQSLLSNTI